MTEEIEIKKEKTIIEIQLEELKLLPRLSEVFASANINFLIWSGASKPYLPTLNNIEDDINNATDDIEKAEKYKEYFEKVMLPNKNIVSWNFNDEICYKWNDDKADKTKSGWVKKNESENITDYNKIYNDYTNFINTISRLTIDRKTTVLSKQVNIFTTNIDIFFEKALEDLELHYNDWFLGKMNPVFSLSNFKQSIIQRSHHFDNRSEIPVFNLLKIHGSLTWKYKESELEKIDNEINLYEKNKIKNNLKIYLSSDLSHFNNTLSSKTWADFIEEYKKKILVVNPEDSKFSETVLNKYYYELLRSYSSELERENSVLFIIGFSMADQHIQEITKRVARSNPTLQIYIFCNSISSKNKMEEIMEVKVGEKKFFNISIFAPDSEDYNYNLETITNEIFKKINPNKKKDETK